jgi:hypothetical protein
MLPSSRIQRRALGGCAGCIGRFIRIVVLALVAGVALIVAIDWLFAPWAFYLGGTFHVLPVWQGIAKVHSSSGDYTLYLWMSPTRGGRTFNLPVFNGWAALCTPTGERFPLRLRAYMFEHPGTDTNGKEMRIDLYRFPWYATWTGAWDHRPQLTFRGRWQNADLVTTDSGSLSVAFLPDGRLYDGPERNQPRARETLPVVIHGVPWTAWFSDCRGSQ